MSEGTKFDQEKPRFELMNAPFLIEMARVLTFGAKKYGDYNWQKGIKISRLIGSVGRHLLATIQGEDLDEESNISHTAHAAINLMFIYWMLKNRPDLDDRVKESK